jgi:hypothetical protein
MRWMLLVLMLLAAPCWADEEEAIAALKTSGVGIKAKDGGKRVYIVLDEHELAPERLRRLDEVSGITGIVLLNHRDRRDTYLPFLKTVKGVRYLEIGGINQPFNDADMKHIGEMTSLEQVYLASDNITDKGLLELAKIAGLQQVSIVSSKVTQKGREKLNSLLPKCVVK